MIKLINRLPMPVVWMLYYLRHPIFIIPGQEWPENWRAWPHCNTQGGCWMHITSQSPWCRCRCFWCLLARHVIRRRLKGGSPVA